MVPLGEYGYKNLKHLILDIQGCKDGWMDTQSLKYTQEKLKYSSGLKYTQVYSSILK